MGRKPQLKRELETVRKKSVSTCKVFARLIIVTIPLVGTQHATANMTGYRAVIEQVYRDAPDPGCKLCHENSPNGAKSAAAVKAMNLYGTDFRIAWQQIQQEEPYTNWGDTAQEYRGKQDALKRVAFNDSDDDGISNDPEIRLGFKPSEASSKPTNFLVYFKDAPRNLTVGEKGTYTINISNRNHRSNLDEFRINFDPLPDQLDYVSATFSHGGCQLVSGTRRVSCLGTDVPPSSTTSIQLKLQAMYSGDATIPVHSTASPLPDVSPDDNEASTKTTIKADTDGDGVADNDDAFPNDPKESSDKDGDGVGDNADTFPNDPKENADTDGDGVGDNTDADDDNDGLPDDYEKANGLDSLDSNDAQKDSDGDGYSNLREYEAGTDPLDANSRPYNGDIVIDFGSSGLWMYLNDSTWSNLNDASPERVISGDLDGNAQDDVIADFSPYGIWVRRNLNAWTKLHGGSSKQFVTGDLDGNARDDLIVDFGAAGLWAYMNDTNWLKLVGESPEDVVTADVDGNGQDDVIGDFAHSGLWIKRNQGSWVKLHPIGPEMMAMGDLDKSGRDDVVLDFGVNGLWAYMNDTRWLKQLNNSPDLIATGDVDGNGADDVLASFELSGDGLWQKLNPGGWSKLNANSPDQMVTSDVDGSGKDDIVATFRSAVEGVYIRRNQTSWAPLNRGTPENLTVGDLDSQ